MSEHDLLDRTEEATPRKLEEARREGLVARSPDLNAVAILLGALVVLKLWGHYPLRALLGFTRAALGNLDARAMGPTELYDCLAGGALLLLEAMMPILAGLVLVAFLASVLQVGFLFSGAPVALRFDRLNPVEGWKSLFSRRGLVRLLAGLFKLAVVVLVVYFTIRSQFASCAELTDASVAEISTFVASCTFLLLLRVGIALLALGLLDYAYQRWQYDLDMRMTRQEVREELKRMEGDPLMRDRRRRMQRMIATQRMMQNLPGADVVIAGAGGVSVALRYESGRMHAPTVVAKGSGAASERIREIAEENGVPVVEQTSLARTLHRRCDAGGQIPKDLHAAVAEVLAFVGELNRMKTRRTPSMA